MAANKVKVGITADVNELVQGTKKAQEAVHKLGTESTKTSKNIKTISGAANAEKRIVNELALQYHKLTDAEKKAYGGDIKRQMDAHIAKLREYKAVQADINNQVMGASSSFSKLGGALGQVGSKMGLPIGSLTALLNPTTAAIAGVAALGAAFVVTAKKTEQFNAELNNLSTRINVPKDELKAFGDEAIQIGNKFGKAGEEVVKQFNFISQQLPGIEKNKKGLFELTEAVNMLSIGMSTDLETATNGVVTVMSKFGLAAGEAEHVANVLAEASRNSGASLEYQSTVFEKVGAAANAVKIPYTDIAAATGILSSSFADASQVGTSLLAMINKLGKQKDEFNPAIVGMQTAVENLKNAHLSYNEIAGMVGPKAAQVVSVLIDQGDAFDALAQKMENTKAAEEMFGVKSDELGFIINKVKTMWENFLLKIGESEIFQTIMGIIKDVITWIEELSTEIQELFSSSNSGSGYADMWKIIREEIKAVLPVLGAVIKAYLVLQDTVMKVVSWIVENVISGIDLVIDCISDIYNEVASVFNEIYDFLAGIWHSLMDPVVEFVNGVIDWFSTLWDNTKSIFDAIWKKITSIFNAVVKPIADVINKIIGFFKGLWNNIKSIFNAIYKKIADTAVFRSIVKVYKWFKDRVTALINIIKDAWNGFLKALGLGGTIDVKVKEDKAGDEPKPVAQKEVPDPDTQDVNGNGGGGGGKPTTNKGGGKKTTGKSGSGKQNKEPEEGTVDWYDKKIKELEKSKKESKKTDQEIADINKKIAEYTEARNKEEARINAENNKQLTTIEDYDKKINELNDKLKKQNLTDEQRRETLRQIVDLEGKRDKLHKSQDAEKQIIELEARVSEDTFKEVKEKFGDRLPFYIDIFKDADTDKEVREIAEKYQNVLGQIIKAPEIDASKFKTPDEHKRDEYNSGMNALNKLQEDYNIGIIPNDETFLSKWNAIKEQMEADGLTVEVEPELKKTKQFKENLGDITDAVSSIGDAFKSIGDMSDDPMLKVAGLVAQSIAQIALGAGKAIAEASDMGPWGWVAFGASIMAQMAAMIAQVHSATGFAEGGIVNGSSTMGDKLLARVNAGEMILNNRQQQNLFNALDKGMDEDTSGPTISTVKVSGGDLYLALKNYGKITKKKTF